MTPNSDDREVWFRSHRPEDLVRFYESFQSTNELIEWMREKPNSEPTIRSVEGDTEVVVVVPTGNYQGGFAEACRQTIFRGLQMVFVESRTAPDPDFRLAHNANIGFSEAMKLRPNWIVFSNDDMYRIDPVTKLVKQLRELDHTRLKAVFTAPSEYHSIPANLCQFRLAYPFAISAFGSKVDRWSYSLLRRFVAEPFYVLYPRDRQHASDSGLRRLRYRTYKACWPLLFRRVTPFTAILDFGVFSGPFVEQFGGRLFDETYINEMEDTDLSIRLSRKPEETAHVDYRIGDYIGSSLGIGPDRELRSVASRVYFSHKIMTSQLDLRMGD